MLLLIVILAALAWYWHACRERDPFSPVTVLIGIVAIAVLWFAATRALWYDESAKAPAAAQVEKLPKRPGIDR